MYQPLKCKKCGSLIAINEGIQLPDGTWLCDACGDKIKDT